MNSDWKQDFSNKKMSPQEAVRMVSPGDTVYIGTASSVAYDLVDALTEYAREEDHITIASGLCLLPMKAFADKKFHHTTYFMGPEERKALANGTLEYSSIHLHEWDTWIREIADIKVAFLEVTPPDENGYMNLGTNGAGLGPSIIAHAKTIIVAVNKNAVWVNGTDSLIHVSQVDAITETNVMPAAIPEPSVTEEVQKISDFIVDQIDDGMTLQLGAGRIGTAIGYGLEKRNDLGIHTEMISDSIMRLIQNGNVTNKKKNFYPDKTVIGFAMGSRALYDYLDHNDDCVFLPLNVVNDPMVIAKNDNMVSINGAVEIDLFGQVSAETVGGTHYSGIGGQVDYVRGAQMSKGGKSFIATEATFGRGEKMGSRIVAHLSKNAVVTTSRADVQYVATEYGCVNLKGLTMCDRVKAMISLAHPDFRDALTEEAKKNRWI